MNGSPRGVYAAGHRDDRLIRALADHPGGVDDLFRRLQVQGRSSWPSRDSLRRTLTRMQHSGHVVALHAVGERQKRFTLSGAGRDWADALR